MTILLGCSKTTCPCVCSPLPCVDLPLYASMKGMALVDRMLLTNGLARWSPQQVMGPFPWTLYWSQKPKKPIIASLPFLISLSWSSSKLGPFFLVVHPTGSTTPPGPPALLSSGHLD